MYIYKYILKNLDSLLTETEVSLGLIAHLITYVWWLGTRRTHHESICTTFFSQCGNTKCIFLNHNSVFVVSEGQISCILLSKFKRINCVFRYDDSYILMSRCDFEGQLQWRKTFPLTRDKKIYLLQLILKSSTVRHKY